MSLLFLGDSRQPYMFPRFLPQDMTDQIVFMQAPHNSDDATSALLIEPAIEGMVVPLVRRVALRLRDGLIGF